MANTHTVETIRQMLKDWNAATEAQRQEALRLAAEAAQATELAAFDARMDLLEQMGHSRPRVSR